MKTAVMVIHGMGQQAPFATLDLFVRGLGYQKAIHRLKPHADWIESYLEVDGVDIFEYYWAHLTERQITLREIVEWLATTSRGATRFYGKAWDYLADFNLLFRVFPVTWLLSPAERLIVDYVGDVAIYTSMDIKSKHHAVRAAILAGAVERLRGLIDAYERVIVVGHSLGSAIGYDALNRINLQMNVDESLRSKASRLAGFVTFGSPLDKIAFWFAERVPAEQVLRKQIVEDLHSYRSTRPASTVGRYLDGAPWVNFHDAKDPISGKLDSYAGVENVDLSMGAAWGAAHTAYWAWGPMFDRIRPMIRGS